MLKLWLRYRFVRGVEGFPWRWLWRRSCDLEQIESGIRAESERNQSGNDSKNGQIRSRGDHQHAN